MRHQIGNPRHALDDIVIGWQPAIGAGLAKAVQAGKDQTRVAGEQRLGFQPQLAKLLRPDRMQQHIGGGEQPVERGLARSGFQIEHQPALAAVAAEEQRRHAGLQPRAGLAGGVALGCLQLDDIGTKIGEPLRAIGPEDD